MAFVLYMGYCGVCILALLLLFAEPGLLLLADVGLFFLAEEGLSFFVSFAGTFFLYISWPRLCYSGFSFDPAAD